MVLTRSKSHTVNQTNGKLKLYDIIRCELESGPRLIRFSRDGRFAYVNCELTNEVLVYAYDASGEGGKFEQIQKVDISGQQRPLWMCFFRTAYRTERQISLLHHSRF
ncbi:MAG: beta-propeller fold lactonase family protein [Lachnospiraceae bacterium]